MTASSIHAVVVYRSGALVTRLAELTGPCPSVRLDGLPLSLLDATARVELEGEDPPAATDLQLGLSVPAEDPSLAPPQDEELLQARLDEDLAKARVKQLRSQRERLQALGPAPRPELAEAAPPPPPVQARVALLRFRGEQLRTLEQQLEQALGTLRHRREQRATLEEARDRASQARNARADELRKCAVVHLEGGSGPFTLKLHYQVPGARWAPAYSLRLSGDLRSGELEVRALVAQRSGEDWSGVGLTLSTAQAQSWADLPELSSLRIGRAQAPPSRSGWREAPEGADALLEDYRRAFGTPPPQPAAPPEPEPEPAWEAAESGHDMPVAAAPMMDMLEEAPMPPPAPAAKLFEPQSAPRRRTKKAAKADTFGALASAPGRGGGGPEPAAGTPGALQAQADQLAYGRMRLSRATTSLRVKTHTELMLEQVQGLSLRPLSLASTRARSAGQDTPPGHHPAHSEDGFDHAWVAEHPLTVPADGAYHSLQLKSASASAEPRYVCVPRVSEQVFRTLRWHNPLDAPLLRGPCDVLVDGGWLLTTELSPTPGRGRLELGLGVEQNLKVARNARFREDSSGLFGRTQDLHHEVEVEVRNLLARPATVELRERLPTSGDQDDDVAVELVQVSPEWQAWEQDPPIPGSHRWELSVPAGQARTCSLHYVVRIPSEHELVGGNRRER
jgi:hypothetical protein